MQVGAQMIDRNCFLRSLICCWEAYWAASVTTGPIGYLPWGTEATIATADGIAREMTSVALNVPRWSGHSALALRGENATDGEALLPIRDCDRYETHLPRSDVAVHVSVRSRGYDSRASTLCAL